MTKTIALVIGSAFLLSTGLATAQTPTAPATTPAPAAPAPAPAAPAAPKAGMAGPEEKAKKAMAVNDKNLANCMTKAGSDEAKKAACQKLHDERQAKIEAAEKKQMEKMGKTKK